LIPLLPLDGGHVVVALWDGLKRLWARLTGRPEPQPVDATRLVPIPGAVAVLLIAAGALLVIADVVRPINLPGGAPAGAEGATPSRGRPAPAAGVAGSGQRVLDQALERRDAVARQDRFQVALDGGEPLAAQRVHVAAGGIRRDLRIADAGRAGVDPSGEGVVEPHRRVPPEDGDDLLHALIRRVQRHEIDAEAVREDLMAQAHRKQRGPGVAPPGD